MVHHHGGFRFAVGCSSLFQCCRGRQASGFECAGKTTPGIVGVTAAPAEPAIPTPPPTSEAEYVNLSNFPTVAAITASPEVAGAGEQIELTSSLPLTGTLQIQGPQDTKLKVDMKAGKALLDLPEEAPAGVYSLTFTDQRWR